MLDRLLECIERLEVLHVADVLAHEGVIVACQAERGLELAAHGQRGWQAERQFDRKRCIPARAAHRQLFAFKHPHHRIVAAGVDLAVVEQKRIRQRRQPLPRLVVVLDDRLVGEVAGGEDQSGRLQVAGCRVQRVRGQRVRE